MNERLTAEDWVRFLVGPHEERKRLAEQSPMMKLATEALEELSRDPEAQRIAAERERVLAARSENGDVGGEDP